MIKKCPKCGADNGPESSACYNCFTSLEDVEASGAPAAEQAPPASAEPQAPSDPGIGQPAPPAQPQSPYAPPPAAPMGANSGAGYGQRPGGPLTSPEASGEPASAVGQPLGSYQGQQQQPPGAYGPPPSPYGPPPGRPGYVRRGDYPRPEPVKSSSPGTIIALVVVLLLIVGGFAYWKFVYEPKTPMGVVRNYIKAAVAGDLATARKSLCRSSQSFLQAREGYGLPVTCRQLILVDNGGQKFEEGKQYVLKLGKVQGSRGQVNMKPGPQTIPEFTNDTLPARVKDGIPFMLVKEDNAWKIDLLSSTLAILGGG